MSAPERIVFSMTPSLRWRLYRALRDNEPEVFVTREEDLLLRTFGHRGSEFLGLYVVIVDIEV